MQLREVMEELGMDYEGVLKRFGGSSALAERLLRKFPGDPTFSRLKEAVERKDAAGMLAQAHTLKGVAGNLGFNGLYEVCRDMVVCLRAENLIGAFEAYHLVEMEYRRVLDRIEML